MTNNQYYVQQLGVYYKHEKWEHTILTIARYVSKFSEKYQYTYTLHRDLWTM